jgi:hypothetical protein
VEIGLNFSASSIKSFAVLHVKELGMLSDNERKGCTVSDIGITVFSDATIVGRYLPDCKASHPRKRYP